MRSVLVVIAALLFSLPSTPAISDEDATDCLALRGYGISPRLHNRCSYDINVVVCCYGQGRLGSCQANNFETVHIKGGGNKMIPSCDNEIGLAACRAPYHFGFDYGACRP